LKTERERAGEQRNAVRGKRKKKTEVKRKRTKKTQSGEQTDQGEIKTNIKSKAARRNDSRGDHERVIYI